MTKPKPIFLVGLQRQDDDFVSKVEQKLLNVHRSIEKAVNGEYHILVYETPLPDPTFQVFYEKDFNEVKYEELKSIITDLAGCENGEKTVKIDV